MSGDVADSTDARSALGQVETGKGLLFWGMKPESTGGSMLLQIVMNNTVSFLAPSFSQSDPKAGSPAMKEPPQRHTM